MDRRTPSPSFRVPKASPLQSLVRRASSRRNKKQGVLEVPSTPPVGVTSNQHTWASPGSPLLHTEFRTSVASTSLSAYDSKSFISDSDRNRESYDHHATLRSSQGSHLSAPREMSMASQYSMDDITASYRDSYAVPPPAPSPTPSQVPTVVVSAEPAVPTPSTSQSHAGRVPSRLPPGTSNFSRPVTISRTHSYTHSDVLPPQTEPPSTPLPAPPRPSDEKKRQVLMRNAHGGSSGSVGHPETLVPTPPSRPPEMQRSNSQVESVYSSYSYYPYDGSPAPSPTTPQGSFPSGSASLQPRAQPQPRPPPQPQPQPHLGPSRSSKHGSETDAAAPPPDPKTAQDFLQLGITHHLANRLTESAACFEKSAVLDGGCGMGMLMWGLTQRHGWGVEKNEDKGFRWLRKAAEMAVVDLESGREPDRGAVQSELVLAIYEVGQSFFRGWGVEKDKKMAVSYFQLAAKLGDPDAQQDLAFCLANGKGCKKDKKEAAKWYRAAVAQGVSDIGLAWIYKEKYQ